MIEIQIEIDTITVSTQTEIVQEILTFIEQIFSNSIVNMKHILVVISEDFD